LFVWLGPLFHRHACMHLVLQVLYSLGVSHLAVRTILSIVCFPLGFDLVCIVAGMQQLVGSVARLFCDATSCTTCALLGPQTARHTHAVSFGFFLSCTTYMCCVGSLACEALHYIVFGVLCFVRRSYPRPCRFVRDRARRHRRRHVA
jgi:hypothetical protein